MCLTFLISERLTADPPPPLRSVHLTLSRSQEVTGGVQLLRGSRRKEFSLSLLGGTLMTKPIVMWLLVLDT